MVINMGNVRVFIAGYRPGVVMETLSKVMFVSHGRQLFKPHGGHSTGSVVGEYVRSHGGVMGQSCVSHGIVMG